MSFCPRIPHCIPSFVSLAYSGLQQFFMTVLGRTGQTFHRMSLSLGLVGAFT